MTKFNMKEKNLITKVYQVQFVQIKEMMENAEFCRLLSTPSGKFLGIKFKVTKRLCHVLVEEIFICLNMNFKI
jgi:hypothetical protein